MPGLHKWHLGEGYGVQVFAEPDRAGRSTITLGESDLEAAAERLTAAGIEHDGVGEISEGRAPSLTDPDGNRIVLVGD